MIYVDLCVVTADGYVLSSDDDDDLPNKRADDLEHWNSEDLAATLCFKLFGFDPRTWTGIRQVRFIDRDDGDKSILYSVCIPERIPPLIDKYYWHWRKISDVKLGTFARLAAEWSVVYRRTI